MTVATRHANPPGYIERGACDRSTRELLQVVLGARVTDPQHVEAITRFIDCGEFAEATDKPDTLRSLVTIPPRIVEVLVAMLEVARRSSLGRVRNEIRCAADVATIARREIGGRTRECVLLIVCDAANRVIKTMVVAQGSADTVPMPVREILHAVLRCDGRAFAIAHNHPAGEIASSDADVSATERVAVAARTVGLRFLGHVVVAGDQHEVLAAISAIRTPG